ncbi:MAG: hypothetical protein A2754_03215 [Candidatus Magasanikbacteria bacterium RIFCSPHIGHO2_01_FULL_47_8]|uniref:TNase-like domain-containing protein n=1 Tax=Candidatus Magasanikbacteria bacterium RIFCSPHIGHO2_01_FULL_47_8 TaxID=1798673 RepID=A0A1F6MG32_9BACT|nr:MAG: hypothetical protein A2754_03215 [Candidatus Magasanikbacteria bacterium RIFCSPHIGHO2_01_FULL_47_8]
MLRFFKAMGLFLVATIISFALIKNLKLLSPKTVKSFIKVPPVSSAPAGEGVSFEKNQKINEIKNQNELIEQYYVVSRVVDGDTLELASGEKVRYIGVDTPESVHPKKPVQCFGKEAMEFNKNLVLGKKVKLVKDVSETDRYGRLLRYVYLGDGTFVNLLLVKEGYAQAATFPPDVKYSATFVAAAAEAREAERGLWSACR